ncbi:MAG: hypothetical protein RBR22_09880 [Desulfuromonas sp.]|nr:hypothetical protein [Desulfuromonas sp.]
MIPCTNSKGLYMLEVLDANGNVTRSTDWMPNIILDQGLLRMGANSDYLNVCSVGSGVSTPQPSNTALQSKLAQSSTVSDVVNGAQAEAPYYAYSRRTFTFTSGSVVGLVGELAVGWGGNAGQLYSRALVRNANGTPQAMPVLADEVLRVTYEHRYYPILHDTTGVVELVGDIEGVFNYTIRASMVSTGTYWVADRVQNYGGGSIGASTGQQPVTAYDGGIGRINEQPTGNRLTVGSMIGTTDGLLARFSFGAAAGQMNLEGGIKSLSFPMGNGFYQIEFTPAIPKNSSNTLSLQFSHSWGGR